MYGLAKIASDNQVYNYLKQNYPEDCIQWAKEVEWKLVKEVPLEDIQMARRPGGAREQDKVKGIAEAVKEGKPMEPVVLVKLPDGTIKIADGYHRTLGFKKAEKKTIKAWVASVNESKGAWDKEMHEKKLNVGKQGNAKLSKTASLLGLVGLGTAIHVAPNLAMKAVKSTETGQKALTGMFSAGVDMGRTNMKMHPNLQSAMEYGIGPESVVEYQLGRSLGKRISHMEPERQDRFINKAKGMTQSYLNRFPDQAKKLGETPVLSSVKHYFDGKGENKVKNLFMKAAVPNDKPVTWKNHAGNAAALVGAGVADPHLLIQPALSGLRKQVAKSPVGSKIFSKGFEQGNSGVPMSKAKETLIDLAVSPSVLDPYRMGKSMKESLPAPVNEELKKRVDIGKIYKGLSEGS